MSPPLYAALLALTAIQRLAELALSWRNLRRTSGADVRRAGTAVEWRLMVALHVALILGPAAEVSLRGRGAPAEVAVPAAWAWTLAQVLRYWSIASLGRAWNARGVVSPGQAVVTRGPYRWIRHPNYLAVILEFLAIPAAGGAWVSLAALNALHAPLLARRIAAEEALLFQVPGYREAMGGKGRFFPGRRRCCAP